MAFKPAPNPAVNKTLAAGFNQKGGRVIKNSVQARRLGAWAVRSFREGVRLVFGSVPVPAGPTAAQSSTVRGRSGDFT